jgi:hypothetical protein
MTDTLQARALQVSSHEMDFVEASSWLIQDELDRRRSRLQDRRYALFGLPERKTPQELDWSYNTCLPKRDIFELGAEVHQTPARTSSCSGRPAPARATWPRRSRSWLSIGGARSSTGRHII